MCNIRDLLLFLDDFYVFAKYEEDLDKFNDLIFIIKNGYNYNTKLRDIRSELSENHTTYLYYILNYLYKIRKNKNSLYITSLKEIMKELDIELDIEL